MYMVIKPWDRMKHPPFPPRKVELIDRKGEKARTTSEAL